MQQWHVHFESLKKLYDQPLNMRSKTWPYGTKKQVTVLNVTQTKNLVGMACTEDDSGEGFALLLNTTSARNAKPGDSGVITFKPGGPTGGYWDYADRDVLL